jgi:hypothetical protein
MEERLVLKHDQIGLACNPQFLVTPPWASPGHADASAVLIKDPEQFRR